MASKLPHLKWVLPDAPHNHEAMSQAWYTPTSFSTVPGAPDDDDQDEEGLLQSVEYLDTLVEKEMESGTDGKRIVVGGFSQGAAVSLLWALVGRDRESVGGVVGLSGYLPLEGRLEKLREERKVEGEGKGGPKIFLAHGSKDMMVPRRLYLKAKEKLEGFWGEERIGGDLYEGLGHASGGREIGDLVSWLEALLPVH
jgi:predicted esterase